jgi:hypothetical protein
MGRARVQNRNIQDQALAVVLGLAVEPRSKTIDASQSQLFVIDNGEERWARRWYGCFVPGRFLVDPQSNPSVLFT